VSDDGGLASDDGTPGADGIGARDGVGLWAGDAGADPGIDAGYPTWTLGRGCRGCMGCMGCMGDCGAEPG
jgi:hypothetical protein